MAEEQQPPLGDQPAEGGEGPALGRVVEVDQEVPAEDHVERRPVGEQGRVEEVPEVEPDAIAGPPGRP